MNKNLALMLIFIFLTASCLITVKPAFSLEDVVENTWIEKAPMPTTARCSLGVAVVNGKIYAIGGNGAGLSPVGINEMYDPESNTWTKLASMPTRRAEFGIAVYQNKIYVIGGVVGIAPYFQDNALSIGITTGITEVYDPATNTWESKASMPTERCGIQANTVGDKIYVPGGFGGLAHPGFRNMTYVYDPANDSWMTMASMPIFQEEYSSAVVDGNIFFISDKVQIFNPKNNQWTTGASPPNAVFQGAAVATTGIMAPKRIYVLGGGSGLNQVYDPYNDSWTMAASMPNGGFNRVNLAVAISNDIIYAIGGSIPGTFNLFTRNDQYTPIGYGSIPRISVLSPLNQTYNGSSVSLIFVVNKPADWASYSLDGKETVTITGNVTLYGLSNGLHNVTVYAKDAFENTGVSETISFSVEELFPTTLVAVILVSVAIVSAGLLVYFVQFKKQQRKQLPSKQQKG